MSGVRAAHARRRSRASRRAEIEIDEATARYSLLPLLIGDSDMNFDAFAFGGEASGSYDVAGKDTAIDLTLDAIDIGKLAAARRHARRPAAGQARRGPFT